VQPPPDHNRSPESSRPGDQKTYLGSPTRGGKQGRGLRKIDILKPSEPIRLLFQGDGRRTVSEILSNSAEIHLIDSPPDMLK
jgi:hypothetical protein